MARPTVTTARPANAETCVLGEGPVWDPERQRLMWVDIQRELVFIGALSADGTVDIVERVKTPGLVCAVAVSRPGDMLIAGAERIAMQSADGVVSLGPRVIPHGSGRRLNDGKPDPAGQFVVGTLSLLGDSSSEALLRVENNGQVTVIDDDLMLSNGLAWTADGARMYNVDTVRRVVFSRSYDAVTGDVGSREEVVRAERGSPDGLCVDAEGFLWIAMWGIGEVHRYTPEGELVHVIEVAAPHTSSVAFVGPELETLIITTATQGLAQAQLAEFPRSGCLFTATPGVKGLRQSLWNGLPWMTDFAL